MAIDPKTLQVQSYDWRWLGEPSISETTYGYSLSTNQGRFTFIPESVVSKGFIGKDRQYYFDQFLDKNFLTNFYGNAALVDFADYTDFKDGQLLQKRLSDFNQGTKGFLVPESFVEQNLRDVKNYNLNTQAGSVTFGAIRGVGEKDGSLVYIPEASGAKNLSAYIAPGGGDALKATYTYTKGGFLGSIANAIASVPFLPEIAGLATGNPYVYASLKGIQAGVSGEDPIEAGLKIGATLLAANAIGGSTAGGGGAGELASVGETGYALTGPISSTPPSVPSAFDQAVTGAISGASPIAPSMQVGTQGFGSATLPSGASVVGASGSLLGGAPIETRNLANYPSATETAYPAVPIEQTYTPAPGSFQEALPGLGVETQASQAPFTAAPGSFAAATAPAATAAGYGLLSQPSSTISLQQALRGANLANQLLNPPEFPGMPMDGGQQPRLGGVDYSGLLGLLQARAGIPNVAGLLSPAQIRYPSSLLG